MSLKHALYTIYAIHLIQPNRERMVQLENFVMMRWEAEATVVPAESRFLLGKYFYLEMLLFTQ